MQLTIEDIFDRYLSFRVNCVFNIHERDFLYLWMS